MRIFLLFGEIKVCYYMQLCVQKFKKFTSLQEVILRDVDENSLYELTEVYPSFITETEKEYCRRLFSSPNNILDFLLFKKIPKSPLLKNALNDYKRQIPWSIGVIYDYRYGVIKSIEIRVGNGFGKYFYKDQPLIFNWLYSDKHKLMLKEVTHRCVDFRLNVIDFLLFNENINVEVAVMKQERSFSHAYGYPLSEVENYILYPIRISNEENSIELKEIKSDMIKSYQVHIRKSELVQRYLDVLKY